jgi:hypothetical protein
MKFPSLPLIKQSRARVKASLQPKRSEQFLLQHAFSLFLGSVVVLLVGFLAFFYQVFYTAVSGKATADNLITTTEKTVNLGAYGEAVSIHNTKVDTGEEFSRGEKTIKNPFVSQE